MPVGYDAYRLVHTNTASQCKRRQIRPRHRCCPYQACQSTAFFHENVEQSSIHLHQTDI